jgi:hypothetical protein
LCLGSCWASGGSSGLAAAGRRPLLPLLPCPPAPARPSVGRLAPSFIRRFCTCKAPRYQQACHVRCRSSGDQPPPIQGTVEQFVALRGWRMADEPPGVSRSAVPCVPLVAVALARRTRGQPGRNQKCTGARVHEALHHAQRFLPPTWIATRAPHPPPCGCSPAPVCPAPPTLVYTRTPAHTRTSAQHRPSRTLWNLPHPPTLEPHPGLSGFYVFKCFKVFRV